MSQPLRDLADPGSFLQIGLPEHLTVELVGECVDRSLSDSYATSTGVLLDFSETKSAELDSLFAVLGFASSQHKQGKEVGLRLPNDDGLRTFLSMWNFDDAFNRALGSPEQTLMVQGDRSFLARGERRSLRALRAARYGSAGNRLVSEQIEIRPLIEADFLPIQGYPLPADLEPGDRRDYAIKLALEESRAWKGEAIRSLLAPRLHGPFDHIANRIVYEAIANAVWHPAADTVRCASVFLPCWESDDTRGMFIIVFYDDGTGVVETLKRELRRGPLRPSTGTPFDATYCVHYSNGNVETWSSEILNKHSFDESSSRESLLAASILPGITCAAAGSNTRPTAMNAMREVCRPQLEPGFGLAFLINSAVQVLQGVVLLRTGSRRMKISQDHSCDARSVEVAIDSFAGDAVPGNIVTVLLPLKMSSTECQQ